MGKTAFVAAVLLLLATLASAQIPTAGNIFFGYSFERSDWSGLDSSLSRPNLHGWEGSLEGKVFPHVGIVADFAGHYGSQSFTEFPPAGPGPVTVNVTGHQYEVMFGPRLSIPIGGFTPFAEALFGIAHINNGGDIPSSSNTSFSTGLGGGIDYRLVPALALRVEGDYLQTRFFSTTQNNLRISTGLVFRF